MRLRKALFVLPNLFTVSSIFCGFYALSVCAEPGRPGQYVQGALAILFAMFFDGFDGRVARLTKTQSEFGMHLDSLADVVSFGAAPALLLYRWALAPLGFWGLFVAFAFAACGALRLARFNVLASRAHANPSPASAGASRYFVGVPIPMAAGAVIALVLAHGVSEQPPPAVPVAIVTLVLSYLMVSNVRYRTFKQVRLTRRLVAGLFLGAGAAAVAAMELRPAVVLLAAIAGYLALGLAEQALGFGRARLERRRARLAAAGLDVDEDEDDDEDDDGDFA